MLEKFIKPFIWKFIFLLQFFSAIILKQSLKGLVIFLAFFTVSLSCVSLSNKMLFWHVTTMRAVFSLMVDLFYFSQFSHRNLTQHLIIKTRLEKTPNAILFFFFVWSSFRFSFFSVCEKTLLFFIFLYFNFFALQRLFIIKKVNEMFHLHNFVRKKTSLCHSLLVLYWYSFHLR